MKTLNILIFLLIFNTFILFGYLTSEITGNVVHERVISNLTRVIESRPGGRYYLTADSFSVNKLSARQKAIHAELIENCSVEYDAGDLKIYAC